jgi:hypothetical protein
MFLIHVHTTENVHSRLHPIIRLNQEIHQDKNEQYPKFYERKSKFDYDQAIHMMTCGNSVTEEELHDHFFHCGKRLWLVFEHMN